MSDLLLAVSDPIRLPALETRTSEPSRTVEEYTEDARAALSASAPFTPQDLYELVANVVVPCSGHAPRTMNFGDRTAKRCAFCDRDETSTTFTEKAHTVPASFGNRHHFTYEECDECNHAHEHLDNALAKYLFLERVLIGVRTREGTPKLKGRDDTYTRFNTVLGRLDIGVDTSRPTESETRMEILGSNSFTLTSGGRPHLMPAVYYGIRSDLVLRHARICVTPSLRSRGAVSVNVAGYAADGACYVARSEAVKPMARCTKLSGAEARS